MLNRYEIDGEVVRIFLQKRNGSEVITLIDLADLSRADQLPRAWYADVHKTTGRLRVKGPSLLSTSIRSNVFMHRFITEAPSGLEVDHRNHDELDNRRVNLRIVTRSGNGQNRVGAVVHSKSGVRNVHWDAKRRKWSVFIKVNNRSRFIGRFESLQEATAAAVQARIDHMPYSTK